MPVLCDTSSIVMLFPIAPEMFVDSNYGCLLIKEIHDELIQTQKFGTKYPWIKTCRPKLKTTVLSREEKKKEELFFLACSQLCKDCVNLTNNRMFDLSREDRKVISHTLALGVQVSTCDGSLRGFMGQEFFEDYKGNLSALEVLVSWIEAGLVTWSQDKQRFLEAWRVNEEPAQPRRAIRKFRALTGFEYLGT